VTADAGRAPTAAAEANHFIGARACGECHKKQLQRWQKDWHARALNPATPAVVVGRFDGAHFKGTSSEAQMRRVAPSGEGGSRRTGYVMRTAGPDGETADFAVDWVIGGKRMQDTVTVFPDGRWQVLPVYYHVTGRGAWVDYTEAKQGVVGPSHPFFWTNWRRNANHECLDCHTTGLRVRFDRPGQRLTTEFADAGVACESCHGPGGRHAESMDKADIVHPGKADPQVALSLCAQCHGPRNPLFPMLDYNHRFAAGERYEDHFQPLVVVNGAGRSGDYFADGRPKTSSFEYQALLQSACFRKGQLTCLTCHSAPHEDHGPNELKLAKGASGSALADASCKGCHPQVAAQAAQHARHRSAAATSCVACHMPKVVQGVLDQFADHAIDIPNPGNTERHGIPSACGLCHEDKSAAALQADVERLWPGVAARQERRLRLADAIDEQTAEHSRPALLAVLADEQEAETLRGAAALLLAQRFPRGAAAALLPLLTHSGVLLRAQGIEALGFAKAHEASSAIAARAHDPALGVRQAAALVLKTLDDPRSEAAARELASDPQSAGLMQPHYVLAQLAFRRGDLSTAAVELERAADRVPYFTDALLGLSALYLQRGQLDLARARVAEALFFDPHNDIARQRQEKLRRLPP
jgi:tetratricopeptide (TPR) repeat protein